MKRAAALLCLVGLATLAACGKTSPVVDDASIETAVSQGGRRALDLGRSNALTPQGVTVNVGVLDRYGEESQAPALVLTWSQADLDRVQWKTATPYTVLDLATPTIMGRFGSQALGEWCLNGEDGRTLTPNLCGETFERAALKFMSGSTKPNN